MGFGMAITRGVRMNAFDGGARSGWFLSRRFWLRMAPQALDAGDHTTGLGPLTSTLGQPSASSCIPTPEDLRCTRTTAQPPFFAASELLKLRARSVSSVTFSGDTAMSTASHPLGAFSRPPLARP